MGKQTLPIESESNELVKTGTLGYIFTTGENRYFYDVVSSKILKVNEILFDVLGALTASKEDYRIKQLNELISKYGSDQITHCLSEIENHKEQKGLFKNIPTDLKIVLNGYSDEVRSPLFNQIILEVTQNCNFRCSYCVFSGNYKYERNHIKLDMTEEIAFSAIDFFLDHFDKNVIPAVTFYGGEPLVNIRLIKKCVNYVTRKKPFAQFTIQTNGYLLNKSTVDFLYKNHFFVSISIDGPKEIHDRCRKLPGGDGTYDKIISNLNYLYEIDKEYYKENVSIKFTLGTLHNFEDINNLRYNHPLLKGLKSSINYINSVGLNDDVNYIEMIKVPIAGGLDERTIIDKAFWKYVKNIAGNIRFDDDILFTENLMKILYRRPITGKELVLKGYCRLGRTKLFVSADGGYKVCDRTTRLPLIGSFNKGMNWNFIEELEKDAIENSKDCYKCWALTMCELCWVHLYSNDSKVDNDIKRMHCQNIKNNFSKWLVRYAQLLEYDGELLKRLESKYSKKLIVNQDIENE